MNKFYIIIDETSGKLITITSDMITAVEDARQYHEHTKNHVIIYTGELVGEFMKQELII